MKATEFLSENYKDNERVCLGLNARNIKDIFQVQCFCLGIESEQVTDEYMSVSTLKPYARKRNLQNIEHIKFFSADLDIWHGDTIYQGMSKEQVLSLLERDIFDKGKIMRPDYLFFTGRGFLLLWRVRKANGKDLTRHDAPTWIKIQKKIAETFSDFCLDASSTTDYSHVFRILGTINSKTNERVRFMLGERKGSSLNAWIEWSGIHAITPKQSVLIHKMINKGIVPEYPVKTRRQASEFIKANLSTYQSLYKKPASQRQIESCIALSNQYGVSLPAGFQDDSYIASSFIQQYRHTSCRYQDGLGSFRVSMNIIESFFRQEKDIIGKREKLLWIYRVCHFAIFGDVSESLSAVLSLNDTSSMPLSRREVERTTRNAVSGKYQDYVCARLAKTFDMSFAELKERYYQKGVMSKTERKQYDKARYSERLRENHKISKMEAITIRRDKVAELLDAGYTQRAIADFLSVSLRTIKSDCAFLKSKGAENSNNNTTCYASPAIETETSGTYAEPKEYSNRNSAKMYAFFEQSPSVEHTKETAADLFRRLDDLSKTTGNIEHPVFFSDGVFIYEAYRVNQDTTEVAFYQNYIQNLSLGKQSVVLGTIFDNHLTVSGGNRFSCSSVEELRALDVMQDNAATIHVADSLLGLCLSLGAPSTLAPSWLSHAVDMLARLLGSDMDVIDKCFEMLEIIPAGGSGRGREVDFA